MSSRTSGRVGPVRLINRVSSLTAPLETMAGVVSATTFFGASNGQVQIPHSSLYPGWTATLEANVFRSGTTAAITNFLAKWGTASNTSNTTILNSNLATTANTGYRVYLTLTWDGTRMVSTSNLSVGASGSPAYHELALTSGQTLFIDFGAQAISAGDSLSLLNVMLTRTN